MIVGPASFGSRFREISSKREKKIGPLIKTLKTLDVFSGVKVKLHELRQNASAFREKNRKYGKKAFQQERLFQYLIIGQPAL